MQVVSGIEWGSGTWRRDCVLKELRDRREGKMTGTRISGKKLLKERRPQTLPRVYKNPIVLYVNHRTCFLKISCSIFLFKKINF